MRTTILALLTAALTAACSSSSYLESGLPFKNTVYVTTDSSYTLAHLHDGHMPRLLHAGRTYYSYSADSIYATQGGLVGEPLHGAYTEKFANQALKSQGAFHLGLKHGEWRYWYPDGTLRETAVWRKGKKTGPFRRYDEKGTLVQRGRMKAGEVAADSTAWWRRLVKRRRSH